MTFVECDLTRQAKVVRTWTEVPVATRTCSTDPEDGWRQVEFKLDVEDFAPTNELIDILAEVPIRFSELMFCDSLINGYSSNFFRNSGGFVTIGGTIKHRSFLLCVVDVFQSDSVVGFELKPCVNG